MENELGRVQMPPRESTRRLVQFFSVVKEKNDARAVVALAAFVMLTVSQGVAIVGAVASLILSVVSLTISLTPASWLWVLIIALSLATIISTTVAFFGQRHIEKTIGNRRWLTDFRPLQIVSLCLVHDEYHITYRYKFVLRPRRPIREFTFRFTWSGDGELKIKLHDKRHSHEALSRLPIGNQRKLVINLGREIDRRHIEVIEFDLITKATRPAQPFVAMPIASRKHPRFNTHLMVAFGPNAKIARVFRETTLLGASGYEDSPQEPETMPESRVLSWRVPVRFGLRYVLRWEYDEGVTMDGE